MARTTVTIEIDTEKIAEIVAERMKAENPNLVEVVEVVRCKDCRFWGDDGGFAKRADGLLFGRCRLHNRLIDGVHTGWCPTENDFCSCGERRNSDE